MRSFRLKGLSRGSISTENLAKEISHVDTEKSEFQHYEKSKFIQRLYTIRNISVKHIEKMLIYIFLSTSGEKKIEQIDFGRVVRIALYVASGTFWGFEKCAHVNMELAKHQRKKSKY